MHFLLLRLFLLTVVVVSEGAGHQQRRQTASLASSPIIDNPSWWMTATVNGGEGGEENGVTKRLRRQSMGMGMSRGEPFWCYECASLELRYKWEMTGLPRDWQVSGFAWHFDFQMPLLKDQRRSFPKHLHQPRQRHSYRTVFICS